MELLKAFGRTVRCRRDGYSTKDIFLQIYKVDDSGKEACGGTGGEDADGGSFCRACIVAEVDAYTAWNNQIASRFNEGD